MRRFSLLVVALFACALSALGDYASATSSATSTAVSTLPPAGEVVELTDDNFDAFIRADTHTDWLVAVVAPWCSHCRQLEPTWRALAKRLADEAGSEAARKQQRRALADRARRDEFGGDDEGGRGGGGGGGGAGAGGSHEEYDLDDDEFSHDPDAGVTIRVATIDSTKQRILTQRFGVRAFPSIYFLRAGETFDYGNRPRTEEALFAFATGGWADLEPSPPWRAPNSLSGRAIGLVLTAPKTAAFWYKHLHREKGWPALAVVAAGLAGPVAVGLGSIAALDAAVTSRARRAAAEERRANAAITAAAAAAAAATAAATGPNAAGADARPHAD